MGVSCTKDLVYISWPPCRVGAGNVRGVQPASHDFAWRWEWNYRPMAWRSRKARRRSLSRLARCILRMAISITALHVRELPDDVALDAPALARVLLPGHLVYKAATSCMAFYSNSLPPTRLRRREKISKKKKSCTGALSSPSIRTEDGVTTGFVVLAPVR